MDLHNIHDGHTSLCFRVTAYMEIGTTNVSTMIGPYRQAIATATQKFGIPYFVIEDPGDVHYVPFNLVSVLPNAADLYGITVDVLKRYSWSTVAVLYETVDGESEFRLLVVRL